MEQETIAGAIQLNGESSLRFFLSFVVYFFHSLGRRRLFWHCMNDAVGSSIASPCSLSLYSCFLNQRERKKRERELRILCTFSVSKAIMLVSPKEKGVIASSVLLLQPVQSHSITNTNNSIRSLREQVSLCNGHHGKYSFHSKHVDLLFFYLSVSANGHFVIARGIYFDVSPHVPYR